MAIHVVIFKIIKDGKDRNQKLHFATNTQGSTLVVVKQAGGGGIIDVLTSAGSLRLNHDCVLKINKVDKLLSQHYCEMLKHWHIDQGMEVP